MTELNNTVIEAGEVSLEGMVKGSEKSQSREHEGKEV